MRYSISAVNPRIRFISLRAELQIAWLSTLATLVCMLRRPLWGSIILAQMDIFSHNPTQ